ncbi:hypothetical protein RND81_02G233700 [Saponaria officinalis]|uniref:Cyclin N-terminal domain-containing protein n=1 Tax=Saponaria officinalis TaxID=3572 RepID=A0AAW1MPT2_SAPOF
MKKMSPPYSNGSSDLLCSEDSSTVDSPETSADFISPANFIVDDDAVSISGFIEVERTSASSPNSLSSSSSAANAAADAANGAVIDAYSRSQSVAWILKMRAFYGFQAVTAYLAVNYMDRFLSLHHLPQTEGWAMQLLSVACMSLAAKMEEPLVPSLLDLQVEGAKFIFEPKTIQRMELLVLDVLDWRLRLVTPFTFISFFSYKLDPSGTHGAFLMARSTNIILANIQEASLQEHWPSSIAAAAILCAASELPSLSFVTPKHAESWCDGLCKDKVKDCFKLMQQSMVEHNRRKSIKVIPQFRVTAQINRVRSYIIDSPSSSSSYSSSSPSSYNNKRRKLNNHIWVDDEF